MTPDLSDLQRRVAAMENELIRRGWLAPPAAPQEPPVTTPSEPLKFDPDDYSIAFPPAEAELSQMKAAVDRLTKCPNWVNRFSSGWKDIDDAIQGIVAIRRATEPIPNIASPLSGDQAQSSAAEDAKPGPQNKEVFVLAMLDDSGAPTVGENASTNLADAVKCLGLYEPKRRASVECVKVYDDAFSQGKTLQEYLATHEYKGPPAAPPTKGEPMPTADWDEMKDQMQKAVLAEPAPVAREPRRIWMNEYSDRGPHMNAGFIGPYNSRDDAVRHCKKEEVIAHVEFVEVLPQPQPQLDREQLGKIGREAYQSHDQTGAWNSTTEAWCRAAEAVARAVSQQTPVEAPAETPIAVDTQDYRGGPASMDAWCNAPSGAVPNAAPADTSGEVERGGA